VKRILLIDGDIVAYMFAAASEQTIDWGDGVVTCSANLDTAKLNVDEHITGLLEELKATEYAVALSDPDVNFRKSIYPPYKSHRKDVRQPIIRRALEEYLVEKHHAKRKPGLEGDDVLGIMATNPKLFPKHDKIIVSDDKDMQTVPCKLYRLGKMQRVEPHHADYFHLYQTLTGDPTDGYPGLPNVGPVKAQAILCGKPEEGPEVVWSLVVEAYEKRGLTEADALVQARCARILRHEDYDYKRKEPILWHP
jgi:DNA polymerase-1